MSPDNYYFHFYPLLARLTQNDRFRVKRKEYVHRYRHDSVHIARKEVPYHIDMSCHVLVSFSNILLPAKNILVFFFAIGGNFFV